jgi:integrating conjugative element protein (TIGR03761 family)
MNLGALRSTMQLTLHTHHASRIWHGRAASERRHGIIGLAGFVSIMAKMKRGAEQDDPYSDWWMLEIERKLDDTKTRLKVLGGEVDQVLADVPPELSLGENLNVQPVKIPLFIGAQLGFLAVYLLADYDNLARRLMLAHHTALIDRHTLERMLDEGSYLLRSTFALAQRYRYSGATRDDVAANNAVARAAREQYGELPQDILEGTRRSRFAPPIVRRSALGGALPAPERPPADIETPEAMIESEDGTSGDETAMPAEEVTPDE